jgi:hypothetical protein
VIDSPVFLVCYSNWDEHEVVSAWTTEDAAEAHAERLREKHLASSGSFDVESLALNKEDGSGRW